MFGYEDLAGLQAIPREQLYAEQARRGPLLDQLRSAGRYSYEIEIVRSDGSRFCALSN
jgi:hypothetical protein